MFTCSARQPPTQLPTPPRKTGSRILRPFAIVAAVASTLAAGTIPALAQAASPGAYSVTISAASPHYPGAVHGKVDGYALVAYRVSHKHIDTPQSAAT